MTSTTESPERVPSANPFRVLPQLSHLLTALHAPDIAPDIFTRIARDELELIRHEIETGARPTEQEVLARCQAALDALSQSRFDPVINGTGVILHTNLGRAPVSAATARAMSAAASGYLSLEIDPETNQRGGRMDEIGRHLRLLTGAESTLVVNNNAAAVFLVLAALCHGKDVIVSRGEAIEIGGSFRIPEVILQSGCLLAEIGTTNRTYAADYARAVTPETGAILRVHPSNFRLEGFTSTPTTSELATVAREHETILIEDLGSGALIVTTQFGLRPEPTVSQAIADGAAIATFSGDKLLGGPQAGIICGRRDLIQLIERHPIARAVRADKVTLAGLDATLRHYLSGEAATQIPIWSMISTPMSDLQARAEGVRDRTIGTSENSTASVGGGSLPGETLPSVAIALESENADELARRLRIGSPRVFPIIRDSKVLIDLRTVMSDQDEALVRRILEVSG